MILAALLGLAAAAEPGHARLDHAQVEVAWVAPTIYAAPEPLPLQINQLTTADELAVPVGDAGDVVVVNRIRGLVELQLAAVAAISVRATQRDQPLGPILGISLGLLFLVTGLLVLGRAPLGPVIFDLVRGALAALAGWVILRDVRE